MDEKTCPKKNGPGLIAHHVWTVTHRSCRAADGFAEAVCGCKVRPCMCRIQKSHCFVQL